MRALLVLCSTRPWWGGSRRTSRAHFDKGDYRIAVQWYERVHGDEERLVFRKGEECVDFVNSTKLRHVIADPSATLQRTRRGWTAVVAGWTAKRKPKRAVGAAEGLRCFDAAGALSLARGLVSRP